MKIKDNFNTSDLIEATNEIHDQNFGSLNYSDQKVNEIKKFLEKETNQSTKNIFKNLTNNLFHAWKKKQR